MLRYELGGSLYVVLKYYKTKENQNYFNSIQFLFHRSGLHHRLRRSLYVVLTIKKTILIQFNSIQFLLHRSGLHHCLLHSPGQMCLPHQLEHGSVSTRPISGASPLLCRHYSAGHRRTVASQRTCWNI